MLLADSISADQAHAWGLVNRLAPPGEALIRATELAGQIAAHSPQALRLCKQSVAQVFLPDEAGAVEQLIPLIEQAFLAEDIREGVRAFLAKEPPQFTGGSSPGVPRK